MSSPGIWKKRFDRFLYTGRAPVENTKSGGVEYLAWCPIHQWDNEEKSTPSAHFNFDKGLWHCKSKNCHRDFRSFTSLWSDVQMSMTEEKEASKGKPKSEPLPSPSQLDRWHADLMAKPEVLDAFREKRGLSIETIVENKIGWRGKPRNRYTIPIYENGELLDVRQYRMNSREAGNKMTSVAGHGGSHLYLSDALEHDEIILTEGELDALTLRDRGFNSMAHTSGAMAWQDKWSSKFEGKTVFICYDDDDDGRKGAQKTAMSLRRRQAKVYIIPLKLPTLKKGDITDFFVKQGNTKSDFQELMEVARTAAVGQPNRQKGFAGDPEHVSVEDSFASKWAGKPVDMIATVHGKGTAPLLLPRKVNFVCGMDWGDKCNKCANSMYNGNREIEIGQKDDALMSMVDKTDEQVQRTLLKMADIPGTCPKVDVYHDDRWSVEELQVMPSVEERSDEVVNPVDRTVYNVDSHNLQLNKTFRITGTSMPHPKDQRSVFMAWDCEPVEVDIERFQMTPEIYESLQIFQPDEWQEQTPWEKLKEIAYDMSINVTKIYGRPELHIGYDLVWHSVSAFYFADVLQVRGWLECLVVGDTRTGKSEVSHRLANHYKSGVVVNADRASFAGLVGGASPKGASKNWGITWGVIPLNDKRLVVLDEAGGLKEDDIAAMSSVRSQGVAEIVKMGGQKTTARTRLCWIANPVDGRPVEEMTNGAMDAIPDFIKTPEDIARFDFAMAAASKDVLTVQIDKERKSSTPHLHSSDDCKLLVTWVWSRKPEDVVFVGDTEEYIFKETRKFTAGYVADLPLVQQQSFHIKLARMAVAVAARLFSTDEGGEKVLVRHEHVDTAVQFLNVVYGMESMGYREYSRRIILDSIRAKKNSQRTRDLLFGDDGIRTTLIRVMNHSKFKNRDFEERGGMMREQATDAADQLIDLGMLRSMSSGYLKMTPELLDILKAIRRDIDEELDREAEEE